MSRIKYVVETGLNVVKIANYPTSVPWEAIYSESAPCYRTLNYLKEYDRKMYDVQLSRHRKHGGGEALARGLSIFNQAKSNYHMISDEHKMLHRRATAVVSDMFKSMPARAYVHPLKHYVPTGSNSGFPHFKKRNEIIDVVMEEAQALKHTIRHSGMKFKDILAPPVCIFVKAVPSDVDKNSTRPVWCFPAAVSVLEAMFSTSLYRTIFKYAGSCNLPICVGKGGFGRARNFINSCRPGQGISTSDYVKGDANQASWRIKNAFSVLEGLIDFTKYDGHQISQEAQDGNKRLWNYVQWYFINTPFVFYDTLYRKKAGVPSGSNFTMLVWIIINLIDKCYTKLRVDGGNVAKSDVIAGGDDGGVILSNPKEHTPESLAKVGLEVGAYYHKEPKSKLRIFPEHTEVQLLSTRFDDPNRIKRDTTDTISRMCYPSRYCRSREEAVSRALTLDLSLCKGDPYVHEFATSYLLHKPVRMWHPVMMDDSLRKYFQYVIRSREMVALAHPAATLWNLFDSWRRDFTWFWVAANL